MHTHRLLALHLIVATTLTSSCGLNPPSATPPSTSVQITSETNSWGNPVSGWSISRDGSGWTMSMVGRPSSAEGYMKVTREWGPAAGRFAQVESLLRDAEAYAGDAKTRREIPCTLTLTDGPYGEVTWRREDRVDTLPVSYLCHSATADRIYSQLDKVRDLAAGWAQGAAPKEERLSGMR